jgi:hypothetical protein
VKALDTALLRRGTGTGAAHGVGPHAGRYATDGLATAVGCVDSRRDRRPAIGRAFRSALRMARSMQREPFAGLEIASSATTVA